MLTEGFSSSGHEREPTFWYRRPHRAARALVESRSGGPERHNAQLYAQTDAFV
jgi:hypothetical protein